VRREEEGRQPWWRHRWPWLLMMGPAMVIIAGLASAYLAVITSDGISPEYRLGLAIGQTLGRVCSTAAVGYSSAVRLDDRGALRVTVSGGSAPPYRLQMRLTHPTRAGVEKVIALETAGKGLYEAASGKLPAGRWQVMLEDAARIWQLGGEWELVAGQPVVLGATRPL
jgi:hypothetical protein